MQITKSQEKILALFFYTNAWEHHALRNIVYKYEEAIPTPHNGYTRLGIRSHAKGTFYSYVEEGKELEANKMYKVIAKNFIVNITFAWEHAVAITNEEDEGKLVSNRFPQFSFYEGFYPYFFNYLILDEQFKHHLWLSSPGGAGRNRVLKIDEMLNYEMTVPVLQEQIKLEKFFNKVDKLLTLHQRKSFIYIGG